MEFDFEIIHNAEINHQASDKLSRLPANRSDCTNLEDDTPVMTATLSKQLDFPNN